MTKTFKNWDTLYLAWKEDFSGGARESCDALGISLYVEDLLGATTEGKAIFLLEEL